MRSTHKPFQTDRSNVLHFMSAPETRWRIDLLKAVTALAVPSSSGSGDPPDDAPGGVKPPPVILPEALVPALTHVVSALDCMATLAEHMRAARHADDDASESNPALRSELEDAMLGAVCALSRYAEASVGDVLKSAIEEPEEPPVSQT